MEFAYIGIRGHALTSGKPLYTLVFGYLKDEASSEHRMERCGEARIGKVIRRAARVKLVSVSNSQP